jgi:hypothetical protein
MLRLYVGASEWDRTRDHTHYTLMHLSGGLWPMCLMSVRCAGSHGNCVHHLTHDVAWWQSAVRFWTSQLCLLWRWRRWIVRMLCGWVGKGEGTWNLHNILHFSGTNEKRVHPPNSFQVPSRCTSDLLLYQLWLLSARSDSVKYPASRHIPDAGTISLIFCGGI